MSTSMIGAAGGGKVTVTGLSPAVVKQGTTVTVKQGANTVASVTGTLSPKGTAFAGVTCEQTRAIATFTVSETADYIPVAMSYSGATNTFSYTVNGGSKVSYNVAQGSPYCTSFGPYTNTSGSTQLASYGAIGVFPKVRLSAGSKVEVDLSHTTPSRNMAFAFLKL